MKSDTIYSKRKIVIRLAFNEFRDSTRNIYPDIEIYSLHDLCKWYDSEMQQYLDQLLNDYKVDAYSRFDYENNHVDILDSETDKRILKLGLNNRTRLKQLNHEHFNIEHGFIFNKEMDGVDA